jgi:uncharacterized protein (DUF58 family)
MNDAFMLFMVFLLLLAVVLQEHFIFTILYLFAGSYLIGGWWERRAMKNLVLTRIFTDRAFLGEEVPLRLVFQNRSWLPLLWLTVHESLPVDLGVHRMFRQVLSLGPHERKEFEISLSARKRGYYRIGPMTVTSGDVLGLQKEQQREGHPDPLIVYPKIIPLSKLALPSRSPMGTLRHHQPIFEDPTRVFGKRDYTPGDSLRRIDWKSSATAGRLQVKLFEPSIALETSIFLNLDSQDYPLKTRYDNVELGITVAASIASWVSSKKQSFGLVSNGLDPLTVPGQDSTSSGPKSLYQPPQPIPPRKGRGHLMRILDVLARIQAGESGAFVDMIRAQLPHLTWGTTLVIITPAAGVELFDALFQARRSGLDVLLVLIGYSIQVREIQAQAYSFKIPFVSITEERDLDIWRK